MLVIKLEEEVDMPNHLVPEGYVARIVDAQLDELLARFGSVEVAGTMWCGKTWTSLSHSYTFHISIQRASRAILGRCVCPSCSYTKYFKAICYRAKTFNTDDIHSLVR